MGGLLSNIWSVAGDSARDDYSLLTLQWFLNYNFGGGWALGSVPIITANWKADSDDRWTIPWGLQVSKITRFGSQPVNVLLGYYYNSEHPEGAADSQVRLQINFMFPTKPNERGDPMLTMNRNQRHRVRRPRHLSHRRQGRARATTGATGSPAWRSRLPRAPAARRTRRWSALSATRPSSTASSRPCTTCTCRSSASKRSKTKHEPRQNGPRTAPHNRRGGVYPLPRNRIKEENDEEPKQPDAHRAGRGAGGRNPGLQPGARRDRRAPPRKPTARPRRP